MQTAALAAAHAALQSESTPEEIAESVAQTVRGVAKDGTSEADIAKAAAKGVQDAMIAANKSPKEVGAAAGEAAKQAGAESSAAAVAAGLAAGYAAQHQEMSPAATVTEVQNAVTAAGGSTFDILEAVKEWKAANPGSSSSTVVTDAVTSAFATVGVKPSVLIGASVVMALAAGAAYTSAYVRRTRVNTMPAREIELA